MPVVWIVIYVFPAYAGMSPDWWGNVGVGTGFPRLRGDEPKGTKCSPPNCSFSPPTRG